MSIPKNELKQRMENQRWNAESNIISIVETDIPCLVANKRFSSKITIDRGEYNISTPTLFVNFYKDNGERVDIKNEDLITVWFAEDTMRMNEKKYRAKQVENPASQNDHLEIILEDFSFAGENNG